MATYLLCSTPVHGHVMPMLAVAADLVRRGHRVVMLTGSRFAAQVAAVGAEHRPLHGIADFDDRDVDAYLPHRARHTGVARAQYDIQSIFVRPIAAQHRAVRALVASERPDALLVDGAFAGVAPMLLGAGSRPPILALGVTPLAQSSRDVAPYGTALKPSSSPLGRLRNRVLGVVARRVLFRQTQRLGARILAEEGVPRLRHSIMDISSAFDRFLQLCAPAFEYPRSDLAANTRCVGPLPPSPSDVETPSWWGELHGPQPVVHVTQGTIDNRDLGRLVEPTLAALADLDVLVVASLGGRPREALSSIPANARVAAYLPYDRLLPRTSMLVTNGGYGGVQHALRAGVPIVVAGDTEDKPEVAARVAWAGVGVDLRTGTPTPAAVREAVELLLADETYGAKAAQAAADIARLDTFALIAAELEDAVARAA